MPSQPRPNRIIALFALAWLGSTVALADDPPRPLPQAEAPAKPLKPGEFPSEVPLPPWKPEDVEKIKPLPPVAIPDDPPPHEGAFFDLPLTIAPPDILIVEVLEALPGRPITGDQMIRPDGTISLGFYGPLYVRGLTLEQAKVKILLHLRRWLSDEMLGLIQEARYEAEREEMPVLEDLPMPDKTGRSPFDLEPVPEKKSDPVPEAARPIEKKPDPEAKPVEKKEGRPTARLSRPSRSGRRPIRRASQVPGDNLPGADRFYIIPREVVQEPRGNPEPVKAERAPYAQPKVIQPADSARVFVDINAHNTKVYYVQGDVGVPGRLPFTGQETVLDALNYAGGLVPTSEQADIHLYRPARGGKPAKDYRIDLEAIRRGVATANLQVFPNDRLVVGRNPIVARTIEVDRAAALINSVNGSILYYTTTARSMAAINTLSTFGSAAGGQTLPLAPLMTAPLRDAMFKEWFEFYWSISSKEGGAMLDEKVFREALIKKLTPAPEPPR